MALPAGGNHEHGDEENIRFSLRRFPIERECGASCSYHGQIGGFIVINLTF